jgi:hypothetical protein
MPGPRPRKYKTHEHRWETLREKFMNGDDNLRQFSLAQKVPYSTLITHAKENMWEAARERHRRDLAIGKIKNYEQITADYEEKLNREARGFAGLVTEKVRDMLDTITEAREMKAAVETVIAAWKLGRMAAYLPEVPVPRHADAGEETIVMRHVSPDGHTVEIAVGGSDDRDQSHGYAVALSSR